MKSVPGYIIKWQAARCKKLYKCVNVCERERVVRVYIYLLFWKQNIGRGTSETSRNGYIEQWAKMRWNRWGMGWDSFGCIFLYSL
jgi:hypothetical protein